MVIQKHNGKKPLWKLIKRHFWTMHVKKHAGSVGAGLIANNYTKVTKNTYLANNVSFNGMKISGVGKVSIGQYFHSGPECRIITDSHNYEGNAIPYDDTDRVRDVIIDDFVWLGSRVIILGGHILERGLLSRLERW